MLSVCPWVRLWSDDGLRLQFLTCLRRIPTVVACRVSPLQKAALVRMVKTGPGQPVTLAIGDGSEQFYDTMIIIIMIMMIIVTIIVIAIIVLTIDNK